MYAFIVICLVAGACADKLGYNYKPVGHSGSGLSFVPGSFGHVSGVGGSHGVGDHSSSSVGSNAGFQSSSGGFGTGGSNGGFGDSSSGFGVGGSNGGFSSGSSVSLGGSHGGGSYAPQAELEKEFYTFTANEEDFTEPAVKNQFASSAKKNLRVIFIKGPENHGLENAVLALAKHAAEQKTAIYVFQKQADLSGLSNKLNTINHNVNNKPEVHFVKYRTHEDAVNAQKAIQSQYDSLGGSAQNYNGGVAPVLNFASKVPDVSHGSHSSFEPSGNLGSSGALSSFGSSGQLGSSGSAGSFGSSGSFGSFGSSEVSAPSTSYIPPPVGSSGPSSTYLPADIARRSR